MAVPKQHRSKSRQGQRRMHIYLTGKGTYACPKCGKAILPHTVCGSCGFYRGKEVKDVLAKLTKKERKDKEKEMASLKEASPSPQGGLNPEELSRPTS